MTVLFSLLGAPESPRNHGEVTVSEPLLPSLFQVVTELLRSRPGHTEPFDQLLVGKLGNGPVLGELVHEPVEPGSRRVGMLPVLGREPPGIRAGKILFYGILFLTGNEYLGSVFLGTDS